MNLLVQGNLGGVWTLTINDDGTFSIALTTGTAAPIFLNDTVLPNQSWQLIIDETVPGQEVPNTVSVAYNGIYPSSIQLTTQPTGLTVLLTIGNGLINTQIVSSPPLLVMGVLPLDILSDVSFVLIEPYVDTTIGTTITLPGPNTVFPLNMEGIYPGAILVVGRGTANVESVVVTAVTSNSFTAIFFRTHLLGDALNGATFPTGLFTQSEMLEYLYHAENEFLVKVRPVFASATQALTVETREYPQPADAIRIERVSSNQKAWMDTSQLSLDLDNNSWQSDETSDDPTSFFQDCIGLDNWGIYPLLQINGITAELWYSRKDINSEMMFLTPFVLPDIFTMYLKYGVLARVFSKDGEQRDDLRAKFCEKRFDFGVMLARMFLFATETLTAEMEADQQQMKKFSPMMTSK